MSLVLNSTASQLDRSKEYRKVPIANIDQTDYFGSDSIIQGVLKAHSALDNSEFNGADAKRWQDFCDSDLAPLLYPNMSGSWTEAYQAFGYVHEQPQLSSLQRVAIQTVGSFAMFMAASRVKSKFYGDGGR